MPVLPHFACHIRAANKSSRALTVFTHKHRFSNHPQNLSISTCPPSGCRCAAMPEGLAIDHERQMNGTMPPYAQHVVIRTGRTDWSPKIEDESDTLGEQIGGGNLARSLKGLVGRGGGLHEPTWPILITNSSAPHHRGKAFAFMSDAPPDLQSVSIFPENFHIYKMSHNPAFIEAFAQNFLQSPRKNRLNIRAEGQNRLSTHFDTQHSQNLAILICGHMSRDTRCGTLGPILQKEFQQYVAKDVMRSKDTFGYGPPTPFRTRSPMKTHPLEYTHIDLCSHIGGHAFAGNVVIYFPKSWKTLGGQSLSPLAGKGIWYGRVEPRHVWGIMEETVKGGRIIEELLRGVHDPKPWLLQAAPDMTSPVKLENEGFKINFHFAD